MNLGPVKADEIIARVLVQSNQVVRSKLAVNYRAFLLSEGMVDISVHRRSHMSDEEAIRYALETVYPRGKTKIYGWAEISVARAEEDGRQVLASPDDNPFHATIRLPPGAATDRRLLMHHAFRLAAGSRWVEPPTEYSAFGVV